MAGWELCVPRASGSSLRQALAASAQMASARRPAQRAAQLRWTCAGPPFCLAWEGCISVPASRLSVGPTGGIRGQSARGASPGPLTISHPNVHSGKQQCTLSTVPAPQSACFCPMDPHDPKLTPHP